MAKEQTTAPSEQNNSTHTKTSDETESTHSQSPDGPLRTLAHAAATTNIARRAQEAAPKFASDALSTVASKAGNVLGRVDDKLVSAGDRVDPGSPPPEPADGPLRSLAHKAASSNIVRRVHDKVPNFASDAVSRTASKADAVLARVDDKIVGAGKQLETDDGKELITAACNLWESSVVFVTMLFMATLSLAEKGLGVERDDGEKLGGAERAKRVVRVAAGRGKERFEKREKQVQGTAEADIYAYGRWFGATVLAVSKCILVALKTYDGPANEYVAPFAERVLTVYPEDESLPEGDGIQES